MGAITNTQHRPWPVPSRPWIMTQTWHNLLFAHWPCPPDALWPLLPRDVTLDTFEGQAWVGVIAFRMTGIRLRGFPVVPMVERFPEINVRTYVTMDGKPGVYFLSLDADNPTALAIARPWFHLLYRNARISFEMHADTVNFQSTRTQRGEPPASFLGTYRPVSEARNYEAGTLENWLTERYCFYSPNRRREIYCGEVHHAHWPLQLAQADIATNTMALSHGIRLPDTKPLLHYAHYMKALIWNARRLTTQTQPETRTQISEVRGQHNTIPVSEL
jgi:uncharacterized protein YqjF (DUF2071 family)